ncbi:MAG: ComF family protein [Dehalococcoidales bacterium]|nr:ComF family protein [Dehalococcoidales bacterium]
MLAQVTKLKRAALDLLFPRWCIGCGREGSYVCTTCRDTFTAITPPVCDSCGRPLFGGACPDCAERSLVIDSIRAPFLFDGLTRHVIHEFKYRNLRGLAPLLAGLLYDYLAESPVPGDVLVPVPLHPKRLRERGYNQSGLLARELGKLTGVPVVTDSLRRVHHTPPLARSSNVDDRRARVADAFASTDGKLKGKRVILIDDVSTSGATLNACATVLKEAGVAGVRGLVIALEL